MILFGWGNYFAVVIKHIISFNAISVTPSISFLYKTFFQSELFIHWSAERCFFVNCSFSIFNSMLSLVSPFLWAYNLNVRMSEKLLGCLFPYISDWNSYPEWQDTHLSKNPKKRFYVEKEADYLPLHTFSFYCLSVSPLFPKTFKRSAYVIRERVNSPPPTSHFVL